MSIITDLAATIMKPQIEEIKEQNQVTQNNLLERMASLELALEDAGWMRLAFGGSEHEFSREGLQKISTLSR
ncbi:MAG: hypothetical protein WAW41_14710, partial [Methylobacter sp.]